MIYPVRFNLKLFSWFQMATKLRRFSHRHNDDLVPLHIHGSLSLNALTTCKWLFWPYGTSSNFDHLQTLLDGLIHKDTIKSSADTFLNYSNPYIAPLQIHIEDNMNDRPHTNYIDPCYNASVHPTTGPVRFLSPVRFLARKAEWSACRNFTSVLFPWSHQATGPVRLAASAYLRFGWVIRRTPRVPRAMPVWATYGPRTGIFNVFHIPRGPCVTRKGAEWRPYRNVREFTQP